eukprot:m.19459 g.19459  ORF g.19459 m.19459 type:complete len:503 (-) comp6587_c0_seq2:84-1592(-)
MAGLNSSQALFGTLREKAPAIAELRTQKWKTEKYKPSSDPPDKIRGFQLPGVSPLAEQVLKSKSGPPGQINLAALSRWYLAQNTEGKKHTIDEWSSTLEYVRKRALERTAASSGTRSSSVNNRKGIAAEIQNQETSVKSQFGNHLSEVGKYKSRLENLVTTIRREIKAMKVTIKELEGWVAARTKWPLKVNEKCSYFRDQRLGIDLVADDVEIELGKENEILNTAIAENTNSVLEESYDVLHDMEEIEKALLADIERKGSAHTIDKSMMKLQLTGAKDQMLSLDSVHPRPATALDAEDWRYATNALIGRAEQSFQNCDTLRTTMKKATGHCDAILRKYAMGVDLALRTKVNQAEEAVNIVYDLLLETKKEIQATDREVLKIEKAIDSHLPPLSYATKRLEERQARPETERTIDSVHEALIQEVAELDAATSALQDELNVNLCNLEELKAMEAMLEEDYGIKKVTLNIERRCVKIRSFLSPDADNYVVVRMLNDDTFFDLMTR